MWIIRSSKKLKCLLFWPQTYRGFLGIAMLFISAFATAGLVRLSNRFQENAGYSWRKNGSRSLLQDKFLIAAMNTGCGGLGNIMWTFASLYGIGKKINRSPLYSNTTSCIVKVADEIMRTFPEFGKRLHISHVPQNETKSVKFGVHCCKYEDLAILEKSEVSETKYLEIWGVYLQDYKFFYDVREDIHDFFRFSREIVTKVEQVAKKTFGQDDFHKLCVYTRKGDFEDLKISSSFQFTEKAMEFTYENLTKRYDNVSVVLLGEDKIFLIEVYEHMKKRIPRMYITSKMPRGNDMYFGTRYCNSLLITAQASTFGWWIGYLMGMNWNENSTDKANHQLGSIFYNSNFQEVPSNTYTFSNYPMEWLPLRLSNTSDATVYVDLEERDSFYAVENANNSVPRMGLPLFLNNVSCCRDEVCMVETFDYIETNTSVEGEYQLTDMLRLHALQKDYMDVSNGMWIIRSSKKLKCLLFWPQTYRGFLGIAMFFVSAFATISLIRLSDKLRDGTDYTWNLNKWPSLLHGQDKFLMPPMNMRCSGLGNIMWTFASLYGIGKKINRSPLYSNTTSCIVKVADEIMRTFPEFGKRLHISHIPQNESKTVTFARHCCKYDDPAILDSSELSKAKYVVIDGSYYLQDYKFFYDVREDIHDFFRFSEEIVTEVEQVAKKTFGQDDFHKLCVYTRKGDFEDLKISSSFQFTEKAMEFTYENLTNRYGNVSVVLLGEDKNFLGKVNEHMKKRIPRMYITSKMPRGNDMYFGTRYCNSLLITAQASTFGWWIGYLMGMNWNENSTDKANHQLGSIFYNSNFQEVKPNTYTFSNYPMEWIPLRLSNTSDATVYVDLEERDSFYAVENKNNSVPWRGLPLFLNNVSWWST